MLNNISGFAQSNLFDNWKEELSNAKGQDRVDLIEQLSRKLQRENIPMADSLSREGITLAKQIGDSLSMYRISANLSKTLSILDRVDEGLEIIEESMRYFNRNDDLAFDKAKYQLDLASLYIRKGIYAKVDSLITNSESYFLNTNDLLWQGKALSVKGFMHIYKNKYDQALNYYLESLRIAEDFNDLHLMTLSMTNIAGIKGFRGDYTEALELNFEALKLSSSTQSNATCYQRIGKIYLALEDWKPALEYMKMSIELKKKMGHENSLAWAYYGVGVFHKRQFNYGESLKYYKKCLTIARKYNIEKLLIQTLGAMGNVYSNLGEPDKGDIYYGEQLKLAKEHNDWLSESNVHYSKGFNAYKAKKNRKALEHILKSYEIIKEKKHLRSLMINNQLLHAIYDSLGNKTKSLFHEEQFYLYQDSISGLQKIKKIGALEQKHLVKPQKDSLDFINQSNTSANNGQGFFSMFNVVIGISLLGLFLLCSFFFLRMNREKDAAVNEKESLEQTKIDQYFEELFARLDQNKLEPTVAQNQLLEADVTLPINDMADFLKTNLSSQNDWASFEKYFEKVHKDFFKNLKTTYPNITINELNMCALLKLNLRNKDIAQIMGIGHDSVRIAQNRLSKKLELPVGEVLRNFVLKL